jgi:NADPH-dependent 2,4-dienoyl-CoA reductase/sulfur reductase-like enzyme
MTVDAVVIGAGPAGLATSRELGRRGVEHVVLERGDRIGYTWANLYDSLVLHTGKHMSALPGLRFPESTPLFPRRRDFVEYLDRYASAFHLPIRTRADVVQVDRIDGAWRIRTRDGDEVRARAVVVASGIAAKPVVPAVPNRDRFNGRVRHSIEYKNPIDASGRRILIVGVGNSAGEIAAELSRAGAKVTVAVRNGAHVVPREVLGIPIQYVAIPLGYLPRKAQRGVATLLGRALAGFRGKSVLPPPRLGGCPRVPLIGFHLADGIRSGAIRLKGDISSFTDEGIRFADGTSEAFDEVMFATGYRAAMDMFGGAVRLDPCGFGLRRRRVVSTDQPDLYFVGHNPDVRGGIFMIGRDARRVARIIATKD